MEKKKFNADNYIGKKLDTINPLAELFSAITDSELTELQQHYLALKMLDILNSEIQTSDSVINGYQKYLDNHPNLTGTVAADKIRSKIKAAKMYYSKIESIRQIFGNHFKKVFLDLYNTEMLSPLEYEDAIEHYANQKPLADLRNDRSSFTKKIRKTFRGFSGSVRGVRKC